MKCELDEDNLDDFENRCIESKGEFADLIRATTPVIVESFELVLKDTCI